MGRDQLRWRHTRRRISIGVRKEFCAECSLALRRFIGGMDSVISIDVENGKIEIAFDDGKFPEEDLRKVARDSIERLGYRIIDDE